MSDNRPSKKRTEKIAGKNGVKLTVRQKLFCDYYLGEARFNATQACRLAGYKESDCRNMGYQNLQLPYIRDYLDRQIAVLAMSQHEVLIRLTEIARSDVAEFLDTDGNFSFGLAKSRGVTHLLKKIKRKTLKKQIARQENPTWDTDGNDDEEILSTEVVSDEVEFEVYSAHEALRDLGKYHGIFTEKVDHSGTVQNVAMTLDQWRAEQEARRAQAAEAEALFDDEN